MSETKEKHPDHDLLKAMVAAPVPYSAYIGDAVSRIAPRHRYYTRAAILRGLRRLAADGLITCLGGPYGYYGFRWDFTAAGRAALNAKEPTSCA